MAKFSEKRVLVTSCDRYMGSPIADAFEQEGAKVIRSNTLINSPAIADQLIAEAGHIDILVANFAEPPHGAAVDAIDEEKWQLLFDQLVHPLMWVCRAAAGQMKARQSGKIIAVTSAAPLRGLPNFSGYCAARGAQNAFIRAIGLELAPFNVQANAIGQNYVENNVYYPPGLIESEKMQKHVRLQVPTQKIASDRETAELALYLASEHCTHMVGQLLPFAGGWATNT